MAGTFTMSSVTTSVPSKGVVAFRFKYDGLSNYNPSKIHIAETTGVWQLKPLDHRKHDEDYFHYEHTVDYKDEEDYDLGGIKTPYGGGVPEFDIYFGTVYHASIGKVVIELDKGAFTDSSGRLSEQTEYVFDINLHSRSRRSTDEDEVPPSDEGDVSGLTGIQHQDSHDF
jgi:hypothetical protein